MGELSFYLSIYLSISTYLLQVSDYSCSLVRGHSDTVMCVSVSSMDPNLLCSGGKDRSDNIFINFISIELFNLMIMIPH